MKHLVQKYAMSCAVTLVAAFVAAAAIGGSVSVPVASAAGHCALNYDLCMWANANYSGGGYATEPHYGAYRHSFTEIAPAEGCTTGSFNDCVSSIDNNGPNSGYYYKNAACGGEAYFNEAYTGTNYVGSFWNDTFSSSSEGVRYSSC